MRSATMIVLLIFPLALSIQVLLSKNNLIIPSNSWYRCQIQLERQNAELIPTTFNISTSIYNSVPAFGNFFDYFYYLNPTDFQCYQESVLNKSYLFPCSFLTNGYSNLRTSVINDVQIQNLPIEQIRDIKFSFVVDNTQFPYPEGAFPYSSMSIDTTTDLQMKISDSYHKLGNRLIYINITVILIYAVIIITLICKNRKLNKIMEQSQRQSIFRKDKIPDQNDKQSDKDSSVDENYTQLIKDHSILSSDARSGSGRMIIEVDSNLNYTESQSQYNPPQVSINASIKHD